MSYGKLSGAELMKLKYPNGYPSSYRVDGNNGDNLEQFDNNENEWWGPTTSNKEKQSS